MRRRREGQAGPSVLLVVILVLAIAQAGFAIGQDHGTPLVSRGHSRSRKWRERQNLNIDLNGDVILDAMATVIGDAVQPQDNPALVVASSSVASSGTFSEVVSPAATSSSIDTVASSSSPASSASTVIQSSPVAESSSTSSSAPPVTSTDIVNTISSLSESPASSTTTEPTSSSAFVQPSASSSSESQAVLSNADSSTASSAQSSPAESSVVTASSSSASSSSEASVTTVEASQSSSTSDATGVSIIDSESPSATPESASTTLEPSPTSSLVDSTIITSAPVGVQTTPTASPSPDPIASPSSSDGGLVQISIGLGSPEASSMPERPSRKYAIQHYKRQVAESPSSPNNQPSPVGNAVMSSPSPPQIQTSPSPTVFPGPRSSPSDAAQQPSSSNPNIFIPIGQSPTFVFQQPGPTQESPSPAIATRSPSPAIDGPSSSTSALPASSSTSSSSPVLGVPSPLSSSTSPVVIIASSTSSGIGITGSASSSPTLPSPSISSTIATSSPSTSTSMMAFTDYPLFSPPVLPSSTLRTSPEGVKHEAPTSTSSPPAVVSSDPVSSSVLEIASSTPSPTSTSDVLGPTFSPQPSSPDSEQSSTASPVPASSSAQFDPASSDVTFVQPPPSSTVSEVSSPGPSSSSSTPELASPSSTIILQPSPSPSPSGDSPGSSSPQVTSDASTTYVQGDQSSSSSSSSSGGGGYSSRPVDADTATLIGTVSAPPRSGSQVVTFSDTSTVWSSPASSSTDWSSQPSPSASYNDAYTPSQSWLIVATTSSSPSQSQYQPSPTVPQDTAATATRVLPSTAAIPNSVPTLIVPANSVVNQANTGTGSSDDPVKDDILISLLLSENEYPWLFVVKSSDATSQLFNTFPTLIAGALNISEGDVKTYGLMVYQPASWDGQEASLLTQWLAYIPSAQFETLNAYLKTSNSPLFNQPGIQGQLAAQINTAYPLAASTGDTPVSNSGKSGGGNSSKKRDIIIGVCVAIGGLLWIGLVFWIYKRVKRSNDKAVHKRLSEHMSMFDGGNHATYGAANDRRLSRADSIAASEIDDRPSSFYASPLDNDRSFRQQQRDRISGLDSVRTGASLGHESPTNYGPSVFGTSWFANPQPSRPVARNPFEDMAQQSYLNTSNSNGNIQHHIAAQRRSQAVQKGMISQPTLQAHSLEFNQ